MNVPNLIVNSVRHSVVEVFATMMSADITADTVAVEPSMAEPNNGVVSLIGLAGAWAGTGSITCSPTLACRVCSAMLMTEATVVNEEVLDAIAELTNMIIGGVKTDLERHLGQLGLSIPTVVFGRNFQTRSAGNIEWVVERFHWDDEEFQVKMCLEKNLKHTSDTPHPIGQTCPVEVKSFV